eukprot:547062-Rhodomonas_salina.3
MLGTDVGYGATRQSTRRSLGAVVCAVSAYALSAYSLSAYTLSAYAAARRCPVLRSLSGTDTASDVRYRHSVGCYELNMRCPVLTWAMVLPGGGMEMTEDFLERDVVSRLVLRTHLHV